MDTHTNNHTAPCRAISVSNAQDDREIPRFGDADLATSVATRFEKVAAACPQRLAVRSSRHTWTYSELNQIADGIARALLQDLGPRSEPIALLFEHDAPAIAAILGVLKAGKFYVALDATFPAARHQAVLADLQAPVLLCDRNNLALARNLLTGRCKLLVYESIDFDSAFETGPVGLSSQTPFAVFYTSGSTGEPKGVQFKHNLPLHRVLVDILDAGISPQDRHTLLTSLAFAASAADFCLPLLNGASVHLYDVRKLGTASFADWLRGEEISIVRSPIALFRHFIASLRPEEHFPVVRAIGLSGAALFRDDVKRARPHFDSACRVLHRYTVSEVGLAARLIMTADTPLDSTVIPAGYAVPGKDVIILDEDGREVAANEAGEIAIRSRYLPAGYWRQPQQTLERFVPSTEEPGMVTCLTGDRGRLRSDGCLEFLGRTDFRVKVRGFRVELSAIEAALRDLHDVEDAAVVAQPDPSGETSLVAYVVANAKSAASAAAVRKQLSSVLPEFSLPARFVFLSRLPLTRNGKVDRKALTSAEAVCDAPRQEGLPMTATELAIVQIWADVLKRDRIARHDSFFDLGGHSLSAAKAIAQINEKLRVRLLPQTLYDTPTLAALAATIERETRALTEAHAQSRQDETVQDVIRRLGF